MTSIADQFAHLRAAGEKALVLFVTAGDPSLEHLPAILSTLAENGADMIEVGIPFSDPIADGPVIQASSQRALDRGVTLNATLEAISRADVAVPVILMGYYNSILRKGLVPFAQAAAAARVGGTIISDLTAEESGPWCSTAHENRIDTIFLAAPTSTDARIKVVSERSTGFVYAVSRTGVTGAGQSAASDVSHLVERIRAHTDTPVCVGFGIRTPEDVRKICDVADGAVVGSRLVEMLAEGWSDSTKNRVSEYVRSCKQSTK